MSIREVAFHHSGETSAHAEPQPYRPGMRRRRTPLKRTEHLLDVGTIDYRAGVLDPNLDTISERSDSDPEIGPSVSHGVRHQVTEDLAGSAGISRHS